jgi:hypothetical protein
MGSLLTGEITPHRQDQTATEATHLMLSKLCLNPERKHRLQHNRETVRPEEI